MAKTLDDLLDDVRQMLQDKREPYRYSDATLIGRINTAFREAQRIRPDIYLAEGTDDYYMEDVPTYTTSDLGTNTLFPVDEKFFQAIVFQVVGTIELGDDQFAVDNRAMTLLAAFRQTLLGA